MTDLTRRFLIAGKKLLWIPRLVSIPCPSYSMRSNKPIRKHSPTVSCTALDPTPPPIRRAILGASSQVQSLAVYQLVYLRILKNVGSPSRELDPLFGPSGHCITLSLPAGGALPRPAALLGAYRHLDAVPHRLLYHAPECPFVGAGVGKVHQIHLSQAAFVQLFQP